MRGAAFLSGLEDALVVDVGGTTTDVGEVKDGLRVAGWKQMIEVGWEEHKSPPQAGNL